MTYRHFFYSFEVMPLNIYFILCEEIKPPRSELIFCQHYTAYHITSVQRLSLLSHFHVVLGQTSPKYSITVPGKTLFHDILRV